MKQADYGDFGQRVEQNFETNGLRLAADQVTNLGGGFVWFKKDYYYYADGQLRFAAENRFPFVTGNMFDRYYEYDFAGRMTKAFTSDQARTGTQSPQYDDYRPYAQSLTYDTWGNTSSRTVKNWNRPFNMTNDFDEATNREATWTYNANGQVTLTPPASNNESKYYAYTFDAAGRLTQNDSYNSGQSQYPVRNLLAYDGNGQVVQRKEERHTQQPPTETFNFYFIRSSVLGGQTLTEIDKEARKRQTIVYAYGRALAFQRMSYQTNPPSTTEIVNWELRDPSGTSVRGVGYFELDPDGMNVGTENPYLVEPEVVDPDRYYFNPFLGGGASLGGWACSLDGIYLPCSIVATIGNGGGAVFCRNNDCSPRRVTYQGQSQRAYFQAYADGYAGFVPQRARYIGNGGITPIGGPAPALVGSGQTQFPNDTNLIARNGASGRVNYETVEVLRNIGVDAFWNLNINIRGGWWNLKINNAERERIPDKDLDLFRKLMERMLAEGRCNKFLKKVGGESRGRVASIRSYAGARRLLVGRSGVWRISCWDG